MTDLRTYRVDGMTCEGCIRSITNALRKAQPDAYVEVDLDGATIRVAGAGEDAVRGAVERAGFTYLGAA